MPLRHASYGTRHSPKFYARTQLGIRWVLTPSGFQSLLHSYPSAPGLSQIASRDRATSKSIKAPWTQRVPRPAGRIEGCGADPFTPFDTRYARGTLWVQDAHSTDFDVALQQRW